MTKRDLTQDTMNVGDRVKGAFAQASEYGTIKEVDGWNALIHWDDSETTAWHPYATFKRI